MVAGFGGEFWVWAESSGWDLGVKRNNVTGFEDFRPKVRTRPLLAFRLKSMSQHLSPEVNLVLTVLYVPSPRDSGKD